MPIERAPGGSAAATAPPLPAAATAAPLPALHTVTSLTGAHALGTGSIHDPSAQVKSVAKAAKVLRCFTSDTAPLTVRDIAARTELPRSTCHAICSTLVTERLLEARPGGGYVLGVEMMVMGGHVVARSGLADAATPVMNHLAASTGSEVHLAQLQDDGHIVYLHRVRACNRAQSRNRFGLRVPAHLSACGRAALAHLDPARVRDTVLARGLSPEGADRLAADLEAARTTGFVVTTSMQEGLTSVAAPVVRRDGHVVGGLSVADRRESFTRLRIATVGAAVRDAATKVSRQLVGPVS